MAAATTNGAKFSANDAAKMPRRNPGGFTVDDWNETLATTQIDDVGDKTSLLLIPDGAWIFAIWHLGSTDMDSDGSPALDMDYVIDEDGDETTLYNAGTLFLGASVDQGIYVGHKVSAPDLGYGILQLKVIAAAATAVQGTTKGLVLYR